MAKPAPTLPKLSVLPPLERKPIVARSVDARTPIVQKCRTLYELGYSYLDIQEHTGVSNRALRRWATRFKWPPREGQPSQLGIVEEQRKTEAQTVRAMCDRYGYDPGEYMVRLGALIEHEIEDLEETLERVDLSPSERAEKTELLLQLQTRAADHAKELLPYAHPKLKQTEITGADGGPISVIRPDMTPAEAAEMYRRMIQQS